jgi:hypothetical protein
VLAGHKQISAVAVCSQQSFLSARALDDVMSLAFEMLAKTFAHVLCVVNDDDFHVELPLEIAAVVVDSGR